MMKNDHQNCYPLLVGWFLLPSGNLLQFAIENCHLEIVDLPIENGDVPICPYSYVNVYQRANQFSESS